MHTPVALIIFNRPDTTDQVVRQIAKAKPPKLLVVADGPRADHPEDWERCSAARAVIERVDWNCDVLKNYSDVHLGCGRRPATGISWVFEQVEKAIILEDDCVPAPTFFRFCQDLLERFRDDERVMHIAGNNYQFGRKRGPYSYFFSRHNICHGWASWRRAWHHFDMGVKLWPALRDTTWLSDTVGCPRAAEYWWGVFDRAHSRQGDVDYWDYQWTFACWAQNGLSILPNKTLISNIGFRKDATHTKSLTDKRAGLSTEQMTFPLDHPPFVVRNTEADRFFIEELVPSNTPKRRGIYSRLRSNCSKIIPRAIRKMISS